jgi:hypothetical protein
MFLRWPNGAFFVGPLMEQDAWGIRLTYGNRELLGETVPVGERYFVYDHCMVLCTGPRSQGRGQPRERNSAAARYQGLQMDDPA